MRGPLRLNKTDNLYDGVSRDHFSGLVKWTQILTATILCFFQGFFVSEAKINEKRRKQEIHYLRTFKSEGTHWLKSMLQTKKYNRADWQKAEAATAR